MKLLKNFYNKFQNRFKTKSKSKLITLFLFALPFLPIFPYVRNSESIFLFGFIEGSVDNFYEMGLTAFNDESFLDNPSEYDKGKALYDLALELKDPLPDPTEHKNYLLEKGMDKGLASCISLRDMFYVDYYQAIEYRRIMNKYVPSPVPIIWFGRSALVRWVLDSVSLPAVNSETYQELNNKCSKYKNIFPPKDYLKGDFSFKK